MLAALLQQAFDSPAGRLPRVRAGARPHRRDRRRAGGRPLHPVGLAGHRPAARRHRDPRGARPGAHPGRRRRRPRDVRRRLRGRQLRPACSRRCSCVGAYVVVLLSTNYIAEGDYAEGEYYFLLLSSLLGMTVMASAPRPHHDLRRPRAALDPRLHARRLAQARPPRQRGRREVLPDGRVRLGGDALRHVAAVRRVGQHAPRRHRRRDRRCPTPRRSSPSASCSWSSASPSRCRPCRSTRGRPTPTRARPRRSPRSSRCCRRRPGSWRCSSSS